MALGVVEVETLMASERWIVGFKTGTDEGHWCALGDGWSIQEPDLQDFLNVIDRSGYEFRFSVDGQLVFERRQPTRPVEISLEAWKAR